MLYATTRNKIDTFTAQRVLKEDRAPDGGWFVPVRLPVLAQQELDGLLTDTPGNCVAKVINAFFGTRLSGRQVEFRMGRNLCVIQPMGHRVAVAECWHNRAGRMCHGVESLMGMVSTELGMLRPGRWLMTAARVALLFAGYSELVRKGLLPKGSCVDLAVDTGDFSAPMAAWYARKIGLPIGTVVLCCDEESSLWDLIAHGQIRLEPRDAESGLEQLIYATLGQEETDRFLACCHDSGEYILGREKHRLLREGLYVCAVSHKRSLSAISNVERTHGYVLDSRGARVYAGLMDYRAICGVGSLAMMVCEDSPVHSEAEVCQALGIDGAALRCRLNIL